MNRRTPLLYVVLCALVLGAASASAQQTSTVVASGAVSATNAQTRISATVGQSAIGLIRNAHAITSQGFWHPSTSAKSIAGSTLSQNDVASLALSCAPNPLSRSTTLSFTIPNSGDVSLSIFNAIGQQVRTVVDRPMNAGTVSQTVDLSDLPSGSYTALLRVGEQRTTTTLLRID